MKYIVISKHGCSIEKSYEDAVAYMESVPSMTHCVCLSVAVGQMGVAVGMLDPETGKMQIVSRLESVNLTEGLIALQEFEDDLSAN